MSVPLRVLHLESLRSDAEAVRRALELAGYVVTLQQVEGHEAFAAALHVGEVDLILADPMGAGVGAEAIVGLARVVRPDTPFIVVSGATTEEQAVALQQAGATDYVLKDRLFRLVPVVKRALREAAEHTARRRAESALHLQRTMLLRNEHLEVIGSLVGGVAHELNNPLALLVGHATLLRRKAGEGPLAERADKIAQAAERCARIMRNFLALARRQPAETGPLDLGSLVRETLEILAYGLRVEGIEVEVDIPPNLPRVPGDADRLRKLLVNLVMNAQVALKETTGTKRLIVRALAAPGAPVLRLVVADNGPGVPAAIRHRIFEPFFSSRPEGEGTGMGLSICRGIVEDHGGELRLEPAPVGACFVAELPLMPQTAAAVCLPEHPLPLAGPRSILVVDDEEDLGALMQDALQLAGHEVDTACTVASAREQMAKRTYHAVVSDVRMPDMDGPHFYREVEAAHPELARRFVFVSGDTLAPTTAAFIQATSLPLLSKPFEIEALVRAVNDVLGA